MAGRPWRAHCHSELFRVVQAHICLAANRSPQAPVVALWRALGKRATACSGEIGVDSKVCVGTARTEWQAPGAALTGASSKSTWTEESEGKLEAATVV